MLDNLEIPTFLDRRKYDAEGKLIRKSQQELNALINSGHTWAPITTRIEAEIRAEIKKQELPLYPENPELPVQVVTTNQRNLRAYPNFAEFNRCHDFDDYPVKRLVTGGGTTYVQVKEVRTVVLNDELRDVVVPFTTDVFRNGIKRPKRDTLCGKAWAIYDKISTGEYTVESAQAFLKQGGMNPSTVRTQYAHWRRFNEIAK